MKLLNYTEFLNESIFNLSPDLIRHFERARTILEEEKKIWITEILKSSGSNLDVLKKDDDLIYSVDIGQSTNIFNLKSDSKNIEIKGTRFIKKLIPGAPDDVIDDIKSALYASIFLDSGLWELKMAVGKEIKEYYTTYNIEKLDTLGNSCMNGKSKDFFDIYSNNPESVKLLVVLEKSSNKLTARALVWNTNKGLLLDRVYYSNPIFKYMIRHWTLENGIVEPDLQSYTVNLKEINFNKYPYIDMFKVICFNKKIISNTDLFDPKDIVGIADRTNGKISMKRTSGIYQASNLEGYKFVGSIRKFIKYSFDLEKWIEIYIDSETNMSYSDLDHFKDNYSHFIKKNIKYFMNIDEEIDSTNIEERLEYLFENEMSQYEDIVIAAIEKYSRLTFNSFSDVEYNLYTESPVNYDVSYFDLKRYEKSIVDSIIEKYCDIDIFNKTLRDLYENDFEYYKYYISHL